MQQSSSDSSIFEALPFPALILTHDSFWKISSVNSRFFEQFRIKADEVGDSPLELLKKLSADPENRSLTLLKDGLKRFESQFGHRNRTDAPEDLPDIILHAEPDADGRRHSRCWKPAISRLEGSDRPTVLMTLTDITGLREEEELRLSKAYKLAKIGTWEYDLSGDHLHWSPITKEVHGFDISHEPDVESTVQLARGEHRDRFAEVVKQALEQHKPFDLEILIRSGQGDERWIRATCDAEYENGECVRFYGISQNVTEKKKREIRLKESLQEKEILLAEIHHRVKNNLAVISGLLHLQSMKESDPQVRSRFQECISRIQTMSAIHEQLYREENFSSLNFSDNIHELVKNIRSSYQTNNRIGFDIQLQPVELNIYQAIPASLIVNEVVTNIFKHAFRESDRGEVTIHLSESGDGNSVQLKISDNGVGLPEKTETGGQSLGVKLIEVLSEQLQGEVTLDSPGQGTRFLLRFPKQALEPS